MKWLERAAFLAGFVTLGKFCETQVGTWPAVVITLSAVFLPVGFYILMQRPQAED